MYSLLLVDDETLILDGLYNNIAWEDSGFTDVYKADDAQKALDTANASKTEYERELAGIRERADSMLASATADANKRSEAILSDARERADGMMRQAKNDISLERRKAESGIRSEIADVSTALTEKLLAREINSDDHRKLIDDFLAEMEDGNDADE